jgi:hypothetical protein
MRTIEEVTKDITQAKSTDQDFESVIQPLYKERTAIIKHNRDDYEDNNYFVLIDCPEHLTHKVKLFTYAHRCAGVWECDETSEGISDVCPHFDHDVEESEDNDGNKSRYYVCVLCRVGLEGNPDED